MALIYPPQDHKTDSASIFFIGHANSSCLINGQSIELIKNGNFCPVLALELGENSFVIDIDGKETKLNITRHKQAQSSSEHKFKDYEGSAYATSFKRICLDPGHGGAKLGTVSPKGYAEKDLNLKLCLEIKKELLAKGFEVILTRESDIDISLEDRVRISKEFEADLFLSIHHNAIPDHLDPLEHHGISAHYYYDESLEFAAKLSAFLAAELEIEDRGAIKQNLFVTRENLYSQALLVECGYLIHPRESELITKPEFQSKLASVLATFLTS